MHTTNISAASKSLATITLILLSGCSKKVTWSEESQLNTGEVIVVSRYAEYSIRGEAGNPLDLAYRPNKVEHLDFNWRGKKYSYTGDASIILIAISKEKQRPVLVARADRWDWHWRHDYRCTVPFYVQLTPDISGQNWTWQNTIDTWLHQTPYNLMLHRPASDENNNKKIYTASDRATLDSATETQRREDIQIDPDYQSDNCIK